MRLYINYVDTEQAIVTQLGRLLEGVGHQVWIDTPQPGATGEWQTSVMRNVLAQCNGVVNVLSEAAIRAKHWANVIDWATVNGMPVVNLPIDHSSLPAEVRSFPTVPAPHGINAAVAEALLQAIHEFEEHSPKNEQAGNDIIALNDLPEGDDYLGFKDYAVAFAQMITNPLVKPPLVVGIYGQWGTGKTFLMHQIDKEVQRIQNEHGGKQKFRGETNLNAPMRVLTVDFDAWAFNASDVLWAGLVEVIF